MYSALALEPGVTSDAATARGIGLAVNGQRPSASNFLLDGSENNQSLLSGPLLTVSTESVQEFRFSTGNFSAEYGRTSGFVVNAVTRSGGAHWHGIAYQDFNHFSLNGNEFQRNAAGQTRLSSHQADVGFEVGGPLLAKRSLFTSTAFDFLQSKLDQQPQTRLFPSPEFVSQVAGVNPDTFGVRLLQRFTPTYQNAISAGAYVIGSVTPTTTLNRFLGLERLDFQRSQSKHQLSVRLAGGWMSEPDFYWSPYPGFSTELTDRTAGISGNLRTALSPRVTNELRFAWTYNKLAFPRPHPEIPNLVTEDCAQPPQGKPVCGGVWLPQAGILYGYENRFQTYQIAENVSWMRGRHIFKSGADLLFRRIGGRLGLGADGELTFTTLDNFLHDSPFLMELGIDRLAYQTGGYQPVDYNREYRNRQAAVFAQDSVRLTGRLSVNLGVRYDNFGAPLNIGATKDVFVQLGAEPGIVPGLAGARLISGGNRQSLFSADNNDWAARFGVSYAVGSDGKTVVRAGYGTFYDRSFDNLWTNLSLNNVLLQPGFLNGGSFSYSIPLIESLAGASPGGTNYNRLLMYQPRVRTPYVHSTFIGIQRQLSPGMVVDVNYVGAFGHKLITTDRINRILSGAPTINGAYNPLLPEILYRGNQGDANYNALTIKLRGSLRRATFRLAYTWSHSIDNQSEPLAGEFDDLSPTNPSSSGSNSGIAAFSRQFASGLDRGNSDFDQRHDLVGMGFWELPGILRGWRISGMGAIRSGLPYTVYAQEGAPVYNPRANLIDPAHWSVDQPADGGRRLLDAAAFQLPADGTLGNTGRNAFPGPGFFSVDASISRSIHFKRLPETHRLIFRADFFNALNHTNLNNPAVALGGPGQNHDFGVALYGRATTDDRSPLLTPLQESPRQIHLLLRFEF